MGQPDNCLRGKLPPVRVRVWVWVSIGVGGGQFSSDNNLIVHSLLINFLNLIKESKAAGH